jgi:heme-degrading monooxygenase HmoA
MITIVWEYQVKANHLAEFERIYAPDGDWAELFRKSKGFVGTRLFQASDDQQLFITMDQWESITDFNTFLSQRKQEYEKLDKQCDSLIEHETRLGVLGENSYA